MYARNLSSFGAKKLVFDARLLYLLGIKLRKRVKSGEQKQIRA